MELTNHTGVIIGSIRSTLGRHAEIDDVTARKFLDQFHRCSRQRMVATKTNYTATARRGSRRWVVQCDQFPGALTEVTRLDQAPEFMVEAIAFVSQVPQDSVQVTVTPAIPEDIAAELARVEDLRSQARAADREAAALHADAARRLQAQGLSVRDIGSVLGLSHQRAQQLITGSS